MNVHAALFHALTNGADKFQKGLKNTYVQCSS